MTNNFLKNHHTAVLGSESGPRLDLDWTMDSLGTGHVLWPQGYPWWSLVGGLWCFFFGSWLGPSFMAEQDLEWLGHCHLFFFLVLAQKLFCGWMGGLRAWASSWILLKPPSDDEGIWWGFLGGKLQWRFVSSASIYLAVRDWWWLFIDSEALSKYFH